MSELTRYRIARAPMAATTDFLNAVHYPAAQDQSIFGCSPGKEPFVTVAQGFLKDSNYIGSTVHVQPPCAGNPVVFGASPHPQGKMLALLAQFVAWLEAGERTAAACADWLATKTSEVLTPPVSASEAARAIVQLQQWKTIRVAVGDSLIASIIVAADRDHLDYLTRLFRAISLIESLAADSLPDGEASTVHRLATRSFVLLPPWIEAARLDALGRAGAPLLARGWACSDLVVVREEWSCYVPGEVAHIENVLKGEKKIRRHERMEEQESRQEEETTTTNLEERDTQTTERQSLKEEAQKQTQLEIGVDGQVDTSGQYGPTRVNTHLGARLSYSVQESRQRATEQSREIVSRAVSRVETKVREFRSTRALRRITELNDHTIDATSAEAHVIGIYRWVDRIVRLQNFRYRHRFLLEFEIPEPAAHYRWLQQHAPAPPVSVDPPPPFRPDEIGNPLINPEIPLAPSHLDRENYQYYAGKFGATGVLPPPDREITVSGAVTLSVEEGQPNGRNDEIEFAPRKSAKIELTIPASYHATTARASLAGHPTLGRWRDQPDPSRDGYVGEVAVDRQLNSLGYHNITAAFTLAGQKLLLSSPTSTATVMGDVHLPAPDPNRHLEYVNAWVVNEGEIPRPPSGSFGTGKLEIGVVMGGAFEATTSVTVTCRLQDSAFETWQLETYDRIYEAHRAASDAYREAQIAAEIRRDETFDGRSPQRNAEIVREELKRQVIEMLLRETFHGFPLRTPATESSVQGPTTRLREAAAAASQIQFLEQAFEWNNMTYIMYPYYWAPDSSWRELQMIEGSDANFVRFLRSGSARVIVPARPNFEPAVMYFSIFGEPWSGGVPPIPGDALYVSVAQEIQEMTGAPDDGEPGISWEERLPTTLVWLDPSENLPRNTNRRLTTEPVINLCGPPPSR